MVILKNPKTGKYYIAPSPKSFYESPNKNSSGGSSGSSSQFSEEQIAQQKQTDKAIADWKAGKTTQQEAANIVTNIRRGGGSGSASNPAKQAAYAASEIKAEPLRQAAAIREAKANLQAALAQREQQRIDLLKADLIKRGAYTEVKTYKDSDTGNPVRMTLIQKKNGGERVVEYTNMITGEKRVYRYETPKGGGGARRTGQLNIGGVSQAENEKVYKDLKDAGLTPKTDRFGRVIEIHSSATFKSYPYTDAGIAKYNEDIEKLNVKNSTVETASDRRKALYNFSSPTNSIKTTGAIAKMLITSSKLIPSVLWEFGVSNVKGAVKVGLYALDEVGYIAVAHSNRKKININTISKGVIPIKLNIRTGKFIIPPGTKAITDNFGRIKKWANYDFKNNPLKDPDYQMFAITTAFTLVAVTSPGTAAKLFGVVKGKAVWDAISDPTPRNIAIAESLFLGSAWKKVKKIASRGDIITAKTGELVPLAERIKQVEFVKKNAGKTIDTVTAKPSGKIKIQPIRAKTSPDFAYGKVLEFATYKIGKAYTTSKYFLEGKATRVQKLLKTGRVNIEKAYVSLLNKKYGTYIKNQLIKRGRVPESFIKKYYAELQMEANRLGKPVVGISPKRLRGFLQAEQEIVKILPSKYTPKKLKFAGFTEDGYRVFSDEGRLTSLKKFLKSKVTKADIDRSYWREIAANKLEYLKGRKVIKGEYAEHGAGHLSANNVDPYAQKYARRMNVKKYGNTFKQHDLAKVSDADSFIEFEHGKVLYDLWRKGKYPDKSIYKLPKPLQRQIMEAYAGHTPVKPRLIDTLIKGWKENSVTKDLIWWAKNKRNPTLQDILTLDRIELPRAGRWNYKVKYNFLDKNAIRRIYGSELNAVKNIRFLDWNSVPRNLKIKLGKINLAKIKLRDSKIFKILKGKNSKITGQNYGWGSTRKRIYKVSKKPSIKILNYKTTNYKKIKSASYKTAYKNGYIDGYKIGYNKPNNYKTNYGKYQKTYSLGYKDAYKGKYSIKTTPYKGKPYKGKPYTSKYQTKPTPYKGKYKSSYNYISGRKITEKKIVDTLPTLGKFTKKKLSKAVPGFYVKIKRYGKIVNLTPKPLELREAKSFLAYTLDNTLSRSAWLEPMGKSKTVVSIPPKMKKYFSKNSKKFRSWKVRLGKKKGIRMGYIERAKYSLDRPTERTQIKRARKPISQQRRKQLIKQLERARASKSSNIPQRRTSIPQRRRTIKRRITPQQRRILLQRLKRARAVRMRNLKGGKK